MTTEEINGLVALAKQTVGCIVEIGTQFGHTCRELANAFPYRHIISVDNSGTTTMCPEQCSEQMPVEKIGYLVRGMPNVLLADCDSKRFLLNGLQVGMVLIDGDHSYAGVKADTELALQYFRTHSSGGHMRFVVWHDVHEDRPPWIGVLDYLRREITPRQWQRINGTMLAYLQV